MKEIINIYVKGLVCKEHSTQRSQVEVQYSVSYFKTYFLKILLDPRVLEITITSLYIKILMRKVFPELGEVTHDVKVKDEVIIKERDSLIVVAQDRRKHLVESGLKDEMKLIHPSCAPPLSVDLVIQMLFFYEDDNAGCSIGGWSAVAITRIINGKNLRHKNRSYFSKGVVAESMWCTDADKNDESRF